MNEIRVENWNQLNEELFKDWWTPRIGRFRAPLAFRGLSDVNYKLETTLMRLGGNYRKVEPHLLKNFKKYAGKDVTKYSGQDLARFNTIWHWLIVGQHHGLPTRLLDWTYSPLVALYFSVANNLSNTDGVIWIVDFIKAVKLLPDKVKNFLIKDDSRVFSIDLLEDIFSGKIEALQNLENISEKDYVIFLEPPSIDDRIINQFGLFSFMSSPDLIMDDWLNNHKDPQLWRKIVIPADLKVEILDKLGQSNISARTMFPGLDGICKWLKMYYSPGLKK